METLFNLALTGPPHLLPGEPVLLPACNQTDLVQPCYRAGCKVIATNANPVELLAVETAFSNITPAHLSTAFSRLGDTLKNGQPLRQIINNLYQTACPACNAPILARYFIWEQHDPQKKYVACPVCNFNDLTPVTPADLQTLDAVETHGLHYHLLLGRTAAPASPNRAAAELLHELYTPRALYAIAEIIIKLEAAVPNADMQRLLKSILLCCLLPASNLFKPNQPPSPLPPNAPLNVPAQFVERNVWYLFESAVAAWRPIDINLQRAPSPQAVLDQHRQTACFWPNPAVQLGPLLPAESVARVAMALPAPNPTIWALQALWSGWLLQTKSGEPRLSPHSVNPTAYQQSLTKLLIALRPALKPDARWLFWLPNASPQHIAAVTLAALFGGFAIEDWQTEHDSQLLTLTQPGEHSPPIIRATLKIAVREEYSAAAAGFLRNHPAPSAKAQFLAVWQSLLFSGLLTQVAASVSPEEALPWVMRQIEKTEINR